MKHKLLYLLLLLAALGTGCLKKNTVTPQPEPSGSYAGQFRIVRRNLGPSSTTYDTLRKANITVTLNGATKLYTVTGDTATAHAGSHGTFAIGAPLINFVDATYSPTAPITKTHLNGTYAYYFDGTIFQMAAGPDTLSLQYDLKKVN
ncbi:MAG TPA: hypothetical protein VK668_11635 [Mucilaginibacter sp.]|nr:hypothetical protein [Mucilaginibacter sp.]